MGYLSNKLFLYGLSTPLIK